MFVGLFRIEVHLKLFHILSVFLPLVESGGDYILYMHFSNNDLINAGVMQYLDCLMII
jgi:hypothetical protein